MCVCPECGDLACGAVTVVARRGYLAWRDFGIQNSYEEEVHRTGFENVGPFTFDGLLYHRLLEGLRPERRAGGG